MKLFSKKYADFSDEDLMIALSKGDKRAFDCLYERYSAPMIGYFMRLLWRDREKAEDFIHDLFAKLINKPELFDTTRSFKTWIYSVASNMCKNEYKKQEVRKNTRNGLDESYQGQAANDVASEVQDKFFAEAFEEKLKGLEDKHKEVFSLRHFDGLSIKEIAEVTNANEGTVKSRLFYATKYLAKGLEEFNPVYNR